LAAERPDVFNAYQQQQGDALEASWKRRLHTRHPSGLNDN